MREYRNTYLELFAFGPLLWRIEVVVLQRVVADDVVVNHRVPLRSEVPWFFFGVVRPIFETRELVLEVQYVESLLVSERAVLILGKHIDELLLLKLSGIALDR